MSGVDRAFQSIEAHSSFDRLKLLVHLRAHPKTLRLDRKQKPNALASVQIKYVLEAAHAGTPAHARRRRLGTRLDFFSLFFKATF